MNEIPHKSKSYKKSNYSEGHDCFFLDFTPADKPCWGSVDCCGYDLDSDGKDGNPIYCCEGHCLCYPWHLDEYFYESEH